MIVNFRSAAWATASGEMTNPNIAELLRLRLSRSSGGACLNVNLRKLHLFSISYGLIAQAHPHLFEIAYINLADSASIALQ